MEVFLVSCSLLFFVSIFLLLLTQTAPLSRDGRGSWYARGVARGMSKDKGGQSCFQCNLTPLLLLCPPVLTLTTLTRGLVLGPCLWQFVVFERYLCQHIIISSRFTWQHKDCREIERRGNASEARCVTYRVCQQFVSLYDKCLAIDTHSLDSPVFRIRDVQCRIKDFVVPPFCFIGDIICQ